MESIDLSHYDLKDEFSAWEVACLMAGHEPASLDCTAPILPGKVKTFLSLIETAHQEARYHFRLFCRGELQDDMAPYGLNVSFATLPSVELWEAHEYVVMHQGMDGGFSRDAYTDKKAGTQAPLFSRKDVEEWLELRGLRRTGYFATRKCTSEKELGERERQTLLKLVIGMAIKGFDYDPSAKKNNAIGAIVASMEGAGLPVSDETIRKYLKEAAWLLPGKPHKG